jgi:hypothetical protein
MCTRHTTQRPVEEMGKFENIFLLLRGLLVEYFLKVLRFIT